MQKNNQKILQKSFFCSICITFAAVNAKTTKRTIASWVLLAVFLPMLVFTSLHVHSASYAADETCTECVHHQCGGHLTQQVQTLHDCVLCQFLSIPVVAAAVVDGIQIDGICKIGYAQCQQTLLVQTLGIIVTRGPPAV